MDFENNIKQPTKQITSSAPYKFKVDINFNFYLSPSICIFHSATRSASVMQYSRVLFPLHPALLWLNAEYYLVLGAP